MPRTTQPNQTLTNEPVAQPQAPQLDPSEKTTKMNLSHDITVNGITYPAGQNVTVPKRQADDLARMDYEYTKQLEERHVRHEIISNAGTLAMGSGAQ